MKRRILFAIFAAVLLFLPACSKTPAPAGGRVQVVAGSYPMFDLTSKVSGNLVDIKTLVPPGTSPRDYSPSADDVGLLEEADIFIYSGSAETWADDLIGKVKSKKLLSVMASKDIEMYSPADEGESPSRRASSHDEPPVSDPNVWLDPANAIIQAEVIKDALVLADSLNRKSYEESFAFYKSELELLNNDLRSALAPYRGRVIAVSRADYGFLCRAFGLEQRNIEGLSPDFEPRPAQLAEISDLSGKNGAATVFFQKPVMPDVAEVISVKTGVKTAVLNPLNDLNDMQIEAGEGYISIMRQNLEVLLSSFKN